MSTDDETAATLDAWWAALSAELGLDVVPIDRDALLGLAGVAAHSVIRPAAPLTTFLVGYAAGLAGGGADALARATEAAAALARQQR
jgi:hypothetical protein